MIKFNGAGNTVARASSIRMVFMVVQIRSGAKILKLWYGCVISESCTLPDVYTEFSSGRINGGLPVPEEYLGTAIQAFLGPKKTDLTPVNCECTVREAMSALGRVPHFSATRQKFGSGCFDHINERGPAKITFARQVEN